jgi:type IV secretory pathway TrbD component
MATQQDGPRKIDVHLSLTRPLLLMGCEREPLLISATIATALIFLLHNAVIALLGVAFWVLTVAALQRMAKSDSELTKTYIRHARYRTFYPAQSSFAAIRPQLKKHQ